MSTESIVELPPPPTDTGDGGQGWKGEPNEKRLEMAKFAIVLVIIVEAIMFAGLISSFLVFKYNSPEWPPKDQPRYPAAATFINTLVLLASGVTMFQFRKFWHQGNKPAKTLATLAILSALLGIAFISMQGIEWVKLINYGLTLKSSVYGSIFYVLIGFHALHVLIAVVWLSLSTAAAVAQKFPPKLIHLEVCGLFWYFVVFFWPVIYAVVYL